MSTTRVEGSRTVWFGLALIALDFLPQVQERLAVLFPDFFATYGTAIIGVVVIVLRFATRDPLRVGRAP